MKQVYPRASQPSTMTSHNQGEVLPLGQQIQLAHAQRRELQLRSDLKKATETITALRDTERRLTEANDVVRGEIQKLASDFEEERFRLYQREDAAYHKGAIRALAVISQRVNIRDQGLRLIIDMGLEVDNADPDDLALILGGK